jgi:acylphosphatase
MLKKTVKIVLSGRVQGVSFRAATKAVANQLGIAGRICNQPDGTVLIVAEADKLTLDLFIDWCREGPDRADVERIQIDAIEPLGYLGFEIVKKL